MHPGHGADRGNARAPACERGTGLIASVAALVVFLAFVCFAVQLLFNLYATSVVTATSYDGARTVATSGTTSDARREAERDMRAHLGSYAQRVRFDWNGTTTDIVRLHVHAVNPRLLFGGAHLLGFDTIDRTVEVRVERAR